MAKLENQKLKLLYLKEYLLEMTDENHPVTKKDVQNYLAAYGIEVERKTIIADIRLLTEVYGLDIITDLRGKESIYYVAEGDFQDTEVKILADLVQSSRFITEEKTKELILKLGKLASMSEREHLKRQVYVQNRVKNENEIIYINVDRIFRAINEDRAIQFKYFKYTREKKKLYHNNGDYYTVSPYAFVWTDGNCYLLSYDHDKQTRKTFRVDKIEDIKEPDIKRRGAEEYPQSELDNYTRQVFGMYSGEVKRVKLRWSNGLAGVCMDRFGNDVFMVYDDPEHFTTTTDVSVSDQFYGWLTGLGTGVEIVSPPEVREKMHEFLCKIEEMYREK